MQLGPNCKHSASDQFHTPECCTCPRGTRAHAAECPANAGSLSPALMSQVFTVTTPDAPTVGDRVAVVPHTDAFMQGDRYGVVTNYTIDPTGVDRYRVRLDRSGRSRLFGADGVSKISN